MANFLFFFEVNTNSKNEFECVTNLLEGIYVEQVKGCYNNEVNVSYMAECTADEYAGVFRRIKSLGELYNQESILVVDTEDKGSVLIFLDGRKDSMVTLGEFVQVSPQEAITSGNWTLIGQNFYICK